MSFSSYTTLGYLHLNFEHLKRFNVSHNNLTEVHEYLFENTTQLKEVDFSHNQIKKLHKLTFSKVPKLSTINISHNQIYKIDSGLFSGLSDLEELNLSDNKFVEIPEDTFLKNSKLKTLNLKNNPIKRLDCGIIQLLNGTALGIVNMLGESIRELDLSGNMLGKVNGTAFHDLDSLERLNVSETNLAFAAGSNPFEHLNKLEYLDMSHNNLTTLNVSLLSTLSNLEEFGAAGNHFDNGLEIIHSLASNLRTLDLSQNFIGTLNLSTFAHLKYLQWLNLSHTHLEHFDVNPMESIYALDISQNNLKRLNVTLLSKTLYSLNYFYAADNDFENTAEIIQYLGSNLYHLDISGNYVGQLNETTFSKTRDISRLSLRRTNLSISTFKPFENWPWLKYLDISNNNLKKLNFTSFYSWILEEINLGENHLTQLEGLTKHSYPKLIKLDITNHNLECTNLSMLKEEWERLEIIGDRCSQFQHNDGVSYAVKIGVSALIIIIVAVVVFLRWKSSSKNSEQMEVSYRRNDNGDELQPVPQPLPESNSEDHIYYEIEEREQTYDHLNHMPISAANPNYDKLVNRDRGTQPQNFVGRKLSQKLYNFKTYSIASVKTLLYSDFDYQQHNCEHISNGRLEVLDLSDDKIEEIQKDTFKTNSKLKTLNFKYNPIKLLDCSIYSAYQTYISSVSNLSRIYVLTPHMSKTYLNEKYSNG
ncbi:protein artichoke-like [Sitodiplosis mosellana]|uniref:protein artichoke-like n=1 Tax=Sitodiplosis mosellana TaxID=263140 RepID=UPI002444B4DA|nr:protein artichoke-like [Sitodiplosis mosellana]